MVSTIKKISGSQRASQQQKAISSKQAKQAQGKFGGPAEAQKVAEGRSTTSVERIRTEEDVIRQREGELRAAKRKAAAPQETGELTPPILSTIAPLIAEGKRKDIQPPGVVGQLKQQISESILGLKEGQILDPNLLNNLKQFFTQASRTPEELEAIKQAGAGQNIAGIPSELIGASLAPALLAVNAAGLGAAGVPKQIFHGASAKYVTPTKENLDAFARMAKYGVDVDKLGVYITRGKGSLPAVARFFWNSKNTGLFQKALASLQYPGTWTALIANYAYQSSGGDFAKPMEKDINKEIIKAHSVGDGYAVDFLENFKERTWDAQAYVDDTGFFLTNFGYRRSRASAKKGALYEELSPIINRLNREVALQKSDKSAIGVFIKEMETKKEEELLDIDSEFKAKEDLLQGQVSVLGSEAEKGKVLELSNLRAQHERARVAKIKEYNALLREWKKKLNQITEAQITQSEEFAEASESGVLEGIFS